MTFCIPDAALDDDEEFDCWIIIRTSPPARREVIPGTAR
jgi:hypothetical protein